jgi:phosphoserine phosphatase RsbU/P
MPTVLIIEDDPTTRIFLRKALEGQGYDVTVAASGAEGLEKAKLVQPALIICDWIMPETDGLTVCRRIRAQPELAGTFFILLTTRTEVADCVRALDSGADEFLTKPVEIAELQARVRAGLRLQRMNRDLQAQKRILESELTEAADYVRSLLPAPFRGNVSVDSRFVPSRQLGGDCFDYYWLDPDYLAIYLLDVSGHGLGAALLSISVLNLLRSQSLDDVNFYQPNHVLQALNETFQMDNQNDKYFTIWYGVYNRPRRQLVYSSAGHPPAVLLSTGKPEAETPAKAGLRDGSNDSGSNSSGSNNGGSSSNGNLQIHKLKTSSMPIGMMPDTRFVNQRCVIDGPGTLYVFSDGIYEIMKEDGTVWGLDAFVQELVTQRDTLETAGLDPILERIMALNITDGLEDDLSLLRVRFK